MIKVLVDSSIWIDYFRTGSNSGDLDFLIDENLICTNPLILAELVPTLLVKNHKSVVDLLRSIETLPLNINWDEIIDVQRKCLSKGVNGIGIPDLIIAQNAIQNNCQIYTLDGHFKTISKITKLKMRLVAKP